MIKLYFENPVKNKCLEGAGITYQVKYGVYKTIKKMLEKGSNNKRIILDI